MKKSDKNETLINKPNQIKSYEKNIKTNTVLLALFISVFQRLVHRKKERACNLRWSKQAGIYALIH